MIDTTTFYIKVATSSYCENNNTDYNKTLTVIVLQNQAVFMASDNNPIKNTPVNIYNYTDSINVSSYSWNIIDNNVTLIDTNKNISPLVFNTVGEKTIKLYINYANGCIDSNIQKIRVIDNYTVDFCLNKCFFTGSQTMSVNKIVLGKNYIYSHVSGSNNRPNLAHSDFDGDSTNLNFTNSSTT